ncbi:MAG TPA: ATP-binding protein [Verrucomicrobiae bacterium]|nr:ATP-binding protein [Verrucomicrobiae bacterium]
MFEFLRDLFSSDFIPHGHCYYWNPAIIWLHVLSDGVITLAYYSIPIMLIQFVRRRRDVAFHWMFVMFGVFIFACGTTHLMNIWEVWHGTYRLGGTIKAITAAASLATAGLLWPLIPKALALPSPAQLSAANRELAAANQALETFTYSVSHDLRAPLRSINGYSQVLMDEYAPQLPEEARRYLGLVQSGAAQMDRLVTDLLEFSRLSRPALRRERVEPSDVVKASLEHLDQNQEDRRIDISIGDLPVCHADPALLKQVYVNLLSNALKFTRGRERATIEIGSRSGVTPGGEPVYFVKDNGIGFDMRHAEKLFSVFHRLHRAEEYEGTGVGLAIVERIVHHHGGRIWAEALPDRGAAFYFTLAEGKSHA